MRSKRAFGTGRSPRPVRCSRRAQRLEPFEEEFDGELDEPLELEFDDEVELELDEVFELVFEDELPAVRNEPATGAFSPTARSAASAPRPA